MLFRSADLDKLDRHRTVAFLFAIVHIGICAGLFRGVYKMPFSGIGLYYEYAGKVLSGALPYRDFVVEYPPFALLFFTLPRLFGESFRWYFVWFQTEVVVFDLVIVGTLYFAARRWRLSPTRILAAYSIAVLAVGPITLHQFDLFAAGFTLLSILAFTAGRRSTAAVMLALGTMTKIYPVLIAPVFVLILWRQRRMRELIFPILAFVATCVVVAAPWLMLAPQSLEVLVRYHTGRGIQIESSYGAIALVVHAIAGVTANPVFAFGAWNLAGPLPDALLGTSTWTLLAALAAAYVLIDRRIRTDLSALECNLPFVATSSALVIAVGLVASKVLSPQYLIWLLPLVPLVGRRGRIAILTTFALAGILTYFIFPLSYDALVARRDWAIGLLLLRNAVLVALAILLAKSLGNSADHTQTQRT